MLLLSHAITANNPLARKAIRYSSIVKVISLVSIVAGGVYYVSSLGAARLANSFQGIGYDSE